MSNSNSTSGHAADAPPLSTAVLISGRGSNLVSLQTEIEAGRIPARVRCVLSSSPDAEGLRFAADRGIAATALDPRLFKDEAAFAEHLLEVCREHEIRLVVLAGFLRKIPAAFIETFPHPVINIHPALLPAFGGKGMYGRHVHEAVLEYGCKLTGVTVHMVSPEYDTGPPVLQEAVPVEDDDTAASLAARVLKAEHRLLPRAVDLFARGRVEQDGRRIRIRPSS